MHKITIVVIFTWGDSRRFNSFANWSKRKYGSRLQKVSVNAGFTCPNRDGRVGVGGCTFCNNRAFNPVSAYSGPEESILLQIEKGLKFIKRRYRKSSRFVAYFQAYSNTYSDIETLKQKYLEALSHPEISGIAIGTRPDCIDEEKLSFIKKLSEEYFISVEYGVESCYDETLLKINRGHDFKSSVDAISMTAAMGLHTGAHFIMGLPGESREDMIGQADIISRLPLNSIKIHQLQIVKDTMLAKEYEQNPALFNFFELPEYVDFIADFLERLNPDIAIERLSGEVPPIFNVARRWGTVRSDQVVSMVEKKLEQKDSWQGKYYKSEKS